MSALITADGLSLHMRVVGNDDAPTVVLVHGLADHHPVVSDWASITVPITVVAGTDDTVAVPPEDVASRLAVAEVVRVPGDHITAPTTNEFVDLVAAVAHRSD